MKKIYYLILLLLFSVIPVFAQENIEYKNIEEGTKILNTNSFWTLKVPKKNNNYFIKRISEEESKLSEFYSADGKIYFSTGCHYDFIYKGSLIGYSNYEMKFYEFFDENGEILRRELLQDEIAEMFPEYKIIKISEFSSTTNCIKLKKKRKILKIIILNDTDKYFYNYDFTTNNSKFEKYTLKGFINIKRKGMIQFSRFGENSKNTPWYILLIR